MLQEVLVAPPKGKPARTPEPADYDDLPAQPADGAADLVKLDRHSRDRGFAATRRPASTDPGAPIDPNAGTPGNSEPSLPPTPPPASPDIAPPPHTTWREPPWISPDQFDQMRRSTAKPPPPPPTAPATAFTLQGRAAPGLYALGWLGSAVGLALFFIALQTDPPVAACCSWARCCSCSRGCRARRATRSSNGASARRAASCGASPLLIFTIQFVLVQIVTVLLVALGVFGPDVTPDVPVHRGDRPARGLRRLSSGLFGHQVRRVQLGRPRLPRLSAWTGAQRLRLGAGVMLGVGDSRLAVGRCPEHAARHRVTADRSAARHGRRAVMIILAVCVFVPIGEELFFRGYNLSAWWRDLGAALGHPAVGPVLCRVHVLNVNVDPNVQDAALAGIKQATIEFLVIAPVGLALGWLFCSPRTGCVDRRTRRLQPPRRPWRCCSRPVCWHVPVLHGDLAREVGVDRAVSARS